jgi:hypothetical protein
MLQGDGIGIRIESNVGLRVGRGGV